VIAGVLGRAGEAGQKKRLEQAKKGKVTWQSPPGLGRPQLDEEEKKAVETAKREKEAIAQGTKKALRSKTPAGFMDGDFDDVV
jgi:hypothetical protein